MRPRPKLSLRKCDAALEIALPEAFRQCAERKRRGVVILGDPGAGKTTHLKRLLLWCLRKGAASIGLPEDMLPVFLPLRDLRDLEHGLDRFIQDQLASPHLKTPAGFGERLLKRGNLLFLLDGLDEVADRSQRKRVAEWIDEGLRLHPTCWFVVTSRFAGYTPDVHLGADFLEMHIRPLSEEQVAGFVHNWYRIVERGLAKDPEQAEGIAREKAEQLINRLREPDFRTRRVFELTRNPLLLTNICLVHRHRGAAPQETGAALRRVHRRAARALAGREGPFHRSDRPGRPQGSAAGRPVAARQARAHARHGGRAGPAHRAGAEVRGLEQGQRRGFPAHHPRPERASDRLGRGSVRFHAPGLPGVPGGAGDPQPRFRRIKRFCASWRATTGKAGGRR